VAKDLKWIILLEGSIYSLNKTKEEPRNIFIE
jgi:hypothetical protein